LTGRISLHFITSPLGTLPAGSPDPSSTPRQPTPALPHKRPKLASASAPLAEGVADVRQLAGEGVVPLERGGQGGEGEWEGGRGSGRAWDEQMGFCGLLGRGCKHVRAHAGGQRNGYRRTSLHVYHRQCQSSDVPSGLCRLREGVFKASLLIPPWRGGVGAFRCSSMLVVFQRQHQRPAIQGCFEGVDWNGVPAMSTVEAAVARSGVDMDEDTSGGQPGVIVLPQQAMGWRTGRSKPRRTRPRKGRTTRDQPRSQPTAQRGELPAELTPPPAPPPLPIPSTSLVVRCCGCLAASSANHTASSAISNAYRAIPNGSTKGSGMDGAVKSMAMRSFLDVDVSRSRCGTTGSRASTGG
jgi:hypothetical protein